MPRLSDLSADERALVLVCIRAIVDGPFIPDREFQTVMGVSREEARHVLESWPPGPTVDDKVHLTINNTFTNLLGYPHGATEAWTRLIGVPAAEVERVFRKWQGGGGRNYFEHLS